MEVPDIGEIKRENTSYGIESHHPQVVYETVGTAEHLALKHEALPTCRLEDLFSKVRQRRITREFLDVPKELQTAPEQLNALRAELEQIKSEFDEVVRGKENLVKMVLKSQDLSEDQIVDLEKRSQEELSRILDERDMLQLLDRTDRDLRALENDLGNSSRLHTGIITTSVDVLRSKLDRLSFAGDLTPPVDNSVSPSLNAAQLNMRLSELERIVGIDSANRLKYAYTDLPSALCQLTHQLLLLDPKKVEAIHERTSTLAAEYDRLAGVLCGYGDYEKKVEVLYSNMNRWIAFSRSLPQIIRKLESCAHLSNEVSTLDSRISNIESQMTSLEATMDHAHTEMIELEKICTSYVESMKRPARP